MANYSIYCYTNAINGKKYIGQSKDVIHRCQPSNYKGCTKFYNAIQKYGWENFSREILEDGLTLEQANELEQHYISIYNTIEDGYNLKTGGLNCEYSEASLQKMSDNCTTKRKIVCLETGQVYDSAKAVEKQCGFANANIIACCKNKLSTAYGYHWVYFENYNIGYQTKPDKRKKAVKCIETNRIYPSAAEASRITGVSRPNITFCCSGKTNTAGGYHWQYYQKQKDAN